MASDAKGTPQAAAERLSALVDGELAGDAVGAACGAWRGDASMRATWHAYHLIGDVLRSDDLASDAARDAAFLSALRTRLAAEPVVLAPEPLPARDDRSRPARARWSWAASGAVAAGFVTVAGVLVVMRGPASTPVPVAQPAVSSANETVATVAAPAGAGPALTVAANAGEPARAAGAGQVQVLRDGALDRYLNAHKRYPANAAYLRNATVDVSGR